MNSKCGAKRVSASMRHVLPQREHLAALDQMMPVERERVSLPGNRPVVDHRLAVILAGRLKPIELEQAVGCREELRLTELRPHRLILDIDRPARHQPRIEEARPLRHRDKIVPIECAAKALAVEHGIGAHAIGQPPVAIDIGKIELPPGFNRS